MSQQNAKGNIAYSTSLIVAAFYYSAMNQDSISEKHVWHVVAHVQLKQTRNIRIVGEKSMVILQTLCKILCKIKISPNFMVWKFCGKAVSTYWPYYGNCTFPQNCHSRRLAEITVFYAVGTADRGKTKLARMNKSFKKVM